MIWIKLALVVASLGTWSWVVGDSLTRNHVEGFERQYYMVQFGAY